MPSGPRFRLLLFLLAAAGPGACERGPDPGSGAGAGGDARQAAISAAEPVEVVDAEGRTVSFAEPPERIVSLVPSATHVLLALDAGHRLVGRTDHDTHSAVAGLRSVGGGLHPSLEVLVGLDPDLVVRFAGETDRATPARLDDAGIAHLAVAPESVADVRRAILELGRIVDRARAADTLVASIDRALAEVRERVRGAAPVRTAWVMAGSPPWVAGPGTYIDELIALAGGENVFADQGRRWASVSPESLVAREPDVILTPEGTRLDERLTRGRTVRTVSPVVELPGPDLPAAAREIARALHPDRFR